MKVYLRRHPAGYHYTVPVNAWPFITRELNHEKMIENFKKLIDDWDKAGRPMIVVDSVGGQHDQ